MTESGSAFYPLHDDKDSLYYHTGQEWADMLPCLKHLDLIASDANGKLSVGDRKWEFFTNKHKYELGTFKGKKDTKKSYFIMKRPPNMKDLNFQTLRSSYKQALLCRSSWHPKTPRT